MTALSAADRNELANTLPLLATDKQGEVLAAAAAANRLIVSCGTTWDAVLAPQLLTALLPA
jgi:hypothetical protein